jgi:hypothetical protein
MSLGALREALLDHGGTLADALDPIESEPGSAPGEALSPTAPDVDAGAGAPQLAAGGPRAHGRERDYELLLEMILEGSLLHYGAPRLVRSTDPDLALLLGDQLYALGLARLAELGDLDAVAELADLISLLAQARAASRPHGGQGPGPGGRSTRRRGADGRPRRGPRGGRRATLVTPASLLTVRLSRRSIWFTRG